jgi:hypothetical protein
MFHPFAVNMSSRGNADSLVRRKEGRKEGRNKGRNKGRKAGIKEGRQE